MLETPNVKSIYHNKSSNFTLEIYAYRKLTQSEIMFLLKRYMKMKKLKKLPHNQTVRWITTFEDNF